MSNFLIHLTRNDSENGGTAEENFLSILGTGQISALNAHCLHRRRLSDLPTAIQEQFRTVCFMGAGVREMQHVVRVTKRKFKLQPLGFIFERDFVIGNGGQPVAYVNRYYDKTVKLAYDAIFEQAIRDGFDGHAWRMLPFVSAIQRKRDFEWEREWRMAGHLRFCDTDVIGVVLPSTGFEMIRDQLDERGIAIISPGMSYEVLFESLSAQKRRSRNKRLNDPDGDGT